MKRRESAASDVLKVITKKAVMRSATAVARANLLAEGVAAERIWVTGNTVIDALAIAAERARRQRPELPEGFPLDRLADGRRMVLITGHRRESFGEGFESLCRAIAELAARYPDCEWVYPVHLNPNVREPVYRHLSGLANVSLIEPLAYLPFVWCMDRSHFVLSDSGGVVLAAPGLRGLARPDEGYSQLDLRPEAYEFLAPERASQPGPPGPTRQFKA